jgi:hypothetical protein
VENELITDRYDGAADWEEGWSGAFWNLENTNVHSRQTEENLICGETWTNVEWKVGIVIRALLVGGLDGMFW